MRQAARFVVLLFLGLGVLTWIAYGALTRTTRAWIEKDLDLRARLAVASARHSLIAHWG